MRNVLPVLTVAASAMAIQRVKVEVEEQARIHSYKNE